jgi:hypothetical protein
MTALRDRCCTAGRSLRGCLLLLAGALPAQQPGPRARADHWALALRVADSLAVRRRHRGRHRAAGRAARSATRGRRRLVPPRHARLGDDARRAQAGFMKNGDDIRRLQLADSALRLATAYAPDSARFWVGLGRFYLNSNVSTMRFAAQGFMDKGLQAARRVQDKAALADAADEKGMVHWRRYETYANRRMLRSGFPATELAEYANRDARDLEQLVNEFTQVLNPPLGENELRERARLLQGGGRRGPGPPERAPPHLHGARRARELAELRSAAARRLRESPWDPQAWLAAGLAAHRLDDGQAATAAFDSALVFLTPRTATGTRASRASSARGRPTQVDAHRRLQQVRGLSESSAARWTSCTGCSRTRYR